MRQGWSSESRGCYHFWWIIVGDKAFAECANLRLIKIPSTVNTIGQNAFEGDPDMMLSVVPGSYAESWAVGKGLPYVAENWFVISELLFDGNPRLNGKADDPGQSEEVESGTAISKGSHGSLRTCGSFALSLDSEDIELFKWTSSSLWWDRVSQSGMRNSPEPQMISA